MNQVIIRDFFPYFLNHLGLTGIAVEVGICEGTYSELFRERWEGQLYVMVDPWVESPANNSTNGPWSKQHFAEYYSTTIKRMKRFPDSSYRIMKTTSDPAYKEFSDSSVDFVYLDGDHTYAGVSNDIKIWWPKLKDGGILAGHDYYNRSPNRVANSWGITDTTSSDNPEKLDMGVKAAVDEFAEKNQQELRIIDTKFLPSWYIIKYTPKL